jgi:hypothetical protein
MITSGTETKITATATQLNSLALLPLAAATFAPAADYFLFKDATDSAGKYQLWTDVATTICGTTANTGLTHSSGVLSIAPADAALAPSADSLMFITAGGLPKKDAVADVVTSITGDGLIASSGVIDTAYYGSMAVGSVRFTGVGDCDAVVVGAVSYARDAAPVVTDGEWTEGLNAGASATNLAAAINGDTRNSGSSYYVATVNTDTVHIYTKSVGGNVAISLTGAAPTEPSVLENLVEGQLKVARQSVMVKHTVTANDVQTAVLVNVPLPFVPSMYIAQIMNATGGVRHDVTDQFTIGATPNRIVLTNNGATHVIAGDVITIFAQE